MNTVCHATAQTPPAVDVRLVTDEAEAVLAILAKRRANETLSDADWKRVFESEGYVRLKKRETSMQRPFEDTDFKTFVMSDKLTDRAKALEETLNRWKRADVTRAATLALSYLPKEARIRAKIYPVIKPRDNSFVFDVKNDPAIFLYLDPAVSREKFENTLAHELHHIGYGTTCPATTTSAEIAKLPSNTQKALMWTGAFGEGFAMLAAAGGPDVHPHAVSETEDRKRWDKDLANFNHDLKRVEQFLFDVVNGKLTEEEIQNTGFSFFGTQGPWYTVGWKMAVLIEKTYGRAKLIDSFCDQRKLFATYNDAAEKHNQESKPPLALWSNSLIERLSALNRDTNEDIVEQLKRATQEMLDAIAPGNKSVWERYLADGSIYVDEEGRVLTKSELIKELSPLPAGYVGSIKIGETKSLVKDNVVVISHLDREELELYGQKIITYFHMTNTWAKLGALWQIVASQVIAIPNERKPATIDLKILDDYVGQYELAPQVTYTVSREGDKLFGQRSGRAKEELLPLCNDVFYRKGAWREEKVFEREAHGRVVKLLDRRENNDLIWKRVR